MLATIRDKASGWIAGIIVGALIISFAFWGVSFYFGGGVNPNVAIVNGEEIKQQTFQRSFYNLRQQMQSIFGDSISLEEDELIKEQTLQKLVNTELVNQVIKENNLRISNAKIVETIQNLDLFKGDDGFDRSKYERGIMSLGMEPAYFEAQLRMDLLAEQLQAGLSESMFVLESELDDIVRLKTQTRDITYSILEVDSVVPDIVVDDAEIDPFYKANSQNYAEPEKVKIAYIDLDVNELAKTVETDDEKLRAYYQDNKDKYDVTEQRSVTKLFVKVEEESTEADKIKARETIDTALSVVNEGKNFEEVIEKFNEDGKGLLEFSEHPYMAKGIMGDEIDEFLFSEDEGSVSEIIETKKGFNIVKVGEIRGGPKNIYENSAEEVEHDYKKSQAELIFFELSDQLTTLAYEHPDTLEIAAEAVGQQIIESEYFTMNDNQEGILSNSNVISSSFNPELISSGENSDAIEISENHIVVLRVIDHKQARIKSLDEVRDDVIEDIKIDKAEKKIKELGEFVVQELNSGKSIDEINSDIEIEWSQHEKIKRDDAGVNRTVLRYAFQAGKPVDKPTITGNRLGSGDYAVILISAVHDADMDEEEIDQIKKTSDLEIRRARGAKEWQEFIDNVRNEADIELYKDNI